MLGYKKTISFSNLFFFTICINVSVYANQAIEYISPQDLHYICMVPDTEVELLNVNQEVVAYAKYDKNEGIIIKTQDQRKLRFSGNYRHSISVIAENSSVTLNDIDADAEKQFKIKAKSLHVAGNININDTLLLSVDEQIDLDAIKINAKQLIIHGATLNNHAVIESKETIHLDAKTVTQRKDSILSAEKDLTISSFDMLQTAGIMRSNGDISIEGKAVLHQPDSKIFANSVYYLKADDYLKDASTTIARAGAIYLVKSTAEFSGNYALSTRDLIVHGFDIQAGGETKFDLTNSAVFQIDDDDTNAGTIDFAGKLLISSAMYATTQKTFLDDIIENPLYNPWTKNPRASVAGDKADIFGHTEQGAYFISGGGIHCQAFEIIANYPIKISGGKVVELNGEINQLISSGNIGVSILSNNAKLQGKISAAKDILVKITKTLAVDADLISKRDINILAKETTISRHILGRNVAITSDKITTTATSSISASESVVLHAKEGLTVNGAITAATSLSLEELKKLSKDELLKYSLVLHSDEGSIKFGSKSVLKYLVGDFKAKQDVERFGAMQGVYETIEGKEITEGGTINVDQTNYITEKLKFTGFHKSKNLRINDIKTVTFQKGSETTSDIFTINDVHDLEINAGASVSSTGQEEALSIKADFIKIDGALRALGALGITGTTINISGTGTVEQGKKENINYVGIDGQLTSASPLDITARQIVLDGLVAGMGPVVVDGKESVKIGGQLDANGNIVIIAQNLSTAKASVIQGKGETVELYIEKDIEHNGKIISDKNASIKLDNGNFEKVQGAIAAGGWVAFDGKIDSSEAIKLVTGNNSTIDAKGIKVITTEPVVINRSIATTNGIDIVSSTLNVQEGTCVQAPIINLTSSEGDLTLDANTTLSATTSVTIAAKGDLIREGRMDGATPLVSNIVNTGDGNINLSAEGRYIDTASKTKTNGTIILKANGGLYVVPLEYVSVSQSTSKSMFRKKTTTTTKKIYYNTTMEAKAVEIYTGGPTDVTNLDIHAEKKKADFYINRIENSTTSSTSKSWRGVGKVMNTFDVAKTFAKQIVKIHVNFARTLTKPITKNVPAINRIAESIYKSLDVCTESIMDGLNPTKVYKVSTYKKCFDGVKNEMVKVIAEVQKIEGKLVKSIVAPSLGLVSDDLSKMVIKADKFQNKGVSYVEAAASFEAVARIALVAAATYFSGGNPGAIALANTMADKYIDKKKMNGKGMLKSFAVNYVSAYVSANTYNSAITSNLARDAAGRVINHDKYTSKDLLFSIASGAATNSIGGHPIIAGAQVGLSHEALRQLIYEHRLNLDDVANKGLAGAAGASVDFTVKLGMSSPAVQPDDCIDHKGPGEQSFLDAQVGSIIDLAAGAVGDFKDALTELLGALTNKNALDNLPEGPNLSNLDNDNNPKADGSKAAEKAVAVGGQGNEGILPDEQYFSDDNTDYSTDEYDDLTDEETPPAPVDEPKKDEQKEEKNLKKQKEDSAKPEKHEAEDLDLAANGSCTKKSANPLDNLLHPSGQNMSYAATTSKTKAAAAEPIEEDGILSTASKLYDKHKASAASGLVDCVPYVGLGKGIDEFVFGRDRITGEDIGKLEAGFGLIGSLVPVPGAKFAGKIAGKAAGKVAKLAEKYAAKALGQEGGVVNKKIQHLLDRTDQHIPQLLERRGKTKDKSALNGAKSELKGVQIDLAVERGVTYNHIEKVQNAQRGLRNRIIKINNILSFVGLSAAERQALEAELSKASKLLDYTKKFVSGTIDKK